MLFDLASLALLALIVAAFFWPLLLAGRWVPRGGGDLVSFLWPMYRFVARSLHDGHVPLWNPFLYSGAPFIADNQSGTFYPVNLLLFALLGEPSYGMMEGLVAFHIWLAGATLFALARGLGLRRPAALFGGVAFALSDLFVTHIGNLNLNATAAWMPLVLFLTHRALTNHRAGQAAAAGAVLAVAALAGHGQMLLFTGLLLASYTAYRLAADWRRGWHHAAITLEMAALVAAVGLGGSALMLLPAQEMAGHTGRGLLPYDEATRYSLPPRALVGLLAPGFYGRGIDGFWGGWDRVEVGYAGVATLVLAAAGTGEFVRSRVARQRQGNPLPRRAQGNQSHAFPGAFFLLLTLGGLLTALGKFTPVYGLLYRLVPTVNQLRAPARIIVLADLGLAALAAYGLNRATAAQETGRQIYTWAGIGATLGGALLLALGLGRAGSLPPVDRVVQATSSIVVAAGLLGLTGVLVWLLNRRRWAAWALLALLAVDLIALGSTVEVEPNNPTLGFRHDDVVAFLQREAGLNRIEVAARAWQPDTALVHGLYDIGGVFNPLGLAPYHAFRWATGERGAPLYNLLGIKYVLADKGKPPGDERLVPVYGENPEIDVYLNTQALPRALLVHEAHVVVDHTAAWEAVHAEGFDPAQTVVLEESQLAQAGPPGPQGNAGESDSRIAFVRYDLNDVELVVETPVAGWLVLSDVYYPGWQATVDDAPADVLRADYAFRGVAIPPGEHTVRMQFRPLTWRVGLGISLATWGGLAIWAGWSTARRRHHPAHSISS